MTVSVCGYRVTLSLTVRRDLHRWAYPSGSTTLRRDGACIVRCSCGHESVGTYFGAVWLSGPINGDAWRIHKRHVDRSSCRSMRTRVRR